MNTTNDFVIVRHCKDCKTDTKQLVKELSNQKFKEITKSEYISWCAVCGQDSYITKKEYKELEYTKETTTKAGGILWRVHKRNQPRD